eukprot:Opistho-1_new@25631
MEELFQLGHVVGQKAAVLADAVAAHGRLARGHILLQEGDGLLDGLVFAHGRGLDPVDQAALAVGALVPGVHLVQGFIALVDGEHRAFDAHRQLRVGHHDGDLDDAVGVGVQAGHLQVDPDQVLVADGQDGGGAHEGLPLDLAGFLNGQYCRSPTLRPMFASISLPAVHPGALSLAFAAALVLSLALKFWLSSRQVRHVARHREAVPAAFAGTVPLAAHQKAADYTIARSRFGLLSLAFGTVVLLGWTLLGGLEALNGWVLGAVYPAWGGMAYQLSLLLAFSLIGALLDLPWELYNTFRIEQRFGFNRMSWKLYLIDGLKGLLVGAVIGLPIAALILWLTHV